MTNREKFKMVFGKNIQWSNSIEPQMLALKSAHIDGINCMEEWLNTEYTEPTTEQAISLEKVKQAKDEMKECSFSLACFNADVFDEDERVVELDNVLIILDKLIAEGK